MTPIAPGRYLVRNPLGRAYLRALDLATSILPRQVPALPAPPASVVVGVGGHIGDALLATCALSAIANAWPRARIGVVTPSWSRVAFDGHPLVANLHVADHWKLDRSSAGRVAKWTQSRASRRRAVGEIARANYDMAIDLYPYYPNMSSLFWRSGVPARLGFTSGGGGNLYTHSLDWSNTADHLTEHHLRLLALAGVRRPDVVSYSLAPVKPESERRAKELAGEGRYVVLHMGSGDVRKERSRSEWAAIAAALSGAGLRVVLTGAGEGERQMAEQLAAMSPSAINLAGQTSMGELRAVLRNADLVVAVDSAPAHLAAAEGARTLVLFSPITDARQWRPLSPRVTISVAGGSCTRCGDRCNPAACAVKCLSDHA